MYDYMRALRQRFYTPPRCEELTQEYEQVRKALHDRLNREEQKLLLRMVDVEAETGAQNLGRIDKEKGTTMRESTRQVPIGACPVLSKPFPVWVGLWVKTVWSGLGSQIHRDQLQRKRVRNWENCGSVNYLKSYKNT